MRMPFFVTQVSDCEPVRRRIMAFGLYVTDAGILPGFLLQRFCWEGVLITKNKNKNLNHKAMKNLTKTVFAAVIAAVVLTSTVVTTFAADPAKKVNISSASKLNRIWVSGNVKIVLTQGDQQSIVGAENYDASKTSVVSNGKTLYINSMESVPVILNITLKDLERIEAYGDAEVVTTNNFDVKYLQLFLNHSANVKMKTTAESLYTVVKDDAALKLKGTADQSTMVSNSTKNLKLGDFESLRSELYASEAIMSAHQTAMNAIR